MLQRIVHEVEEQEVQEGCAGLNDGLSTAKRETDQLRVELAEVRGGTLIRAQANQSGKGPFGPKSTNPTASSKW